MNTDLRKFTQQLITLRYQALEYEAVTDEGRYFADGQANGFEAALEALYTESAGQYGVGYCHLFDIGPALPGRALLSPTA